MMYRGRRGGKATCRNCYSRKVVTIEIIPPDNFRVSINDKEEEHCTCEYHREKRTSLNIHVVNINGAARFLELELKGIRE